MGIKFEGILSKCYPPYPDSSVCNSGTHWQHAQPPLTCSITHITHTPRPWSDWQIYGSIHPIGKL